MNHLQENQRRLSERIDRVATEVRVYVVITWLALILQAVYVAKVSGDTPAQAAIAAYMDASLLPPEVAAQRLYLWNPKQSESLERAVWLAINSSLTRTNITIQPQILAGGKLIAVDLAALAPNASDFRTLLLLVESLALDEPYFHRTFPVSAHPAVECGRFLFGGRWHTSRRFVAPAEHLGIGSALFDVTGRINPIMRVDHFVVKVMSTTRGGRYQDFRGWPNGLKLADYLATRGANEKLVSSLGADERVAIVRSGVSGKTRRVDYFYGVGVRPTVGLPLVAITRDVSDESVDPNADPFYNLLNFHFDASEVFAHLPNGLLEYSLFNGDGRMVTEVPPEVAVDHEIPAPHTQRLEPAVSCIRCHWQKKHDGWRLLKNDVQSMLALRSNGSRVDVLDDLSGGLDVGDTLRKLAALYAGDWHEPFRLARNYLSDVVFRGTRATVAQLGTDYANLWQSRVYNLVTPGTACYELGYPPDDPSKAVDTLRMLLRPLPSIAGGPPLEDAVVALMESGIGVNRYQWDRVYVDLQLRAIQNMPKTKPAARKKP